MGGLSRPFDSLLIGKLVSQDGFFVKKKIGKKSVAFSPPNPKGKGVFFYAQAGNLKAVRFGGPARKNLHPSGGGRRVSTVQEEQYGKVHKNVESGCSSQEKGRRQRAR
jgi:hypothetical protein